MKALFCPCGTRVFFENSQCLNCGRTIGFDPVSLSIIEPQNRHRRCRNWLEYDTCNWLIEQHDDHEFCVSCRMNRTIPNLENGENRKRWAILEQAKRRLFFTLLDLGLPITSVSPGVPDLAFDFIEDQRSNPNVREQHVATGHYAGVITVNVAEADDLFRLRMQRQMGERYRTVLGHLRHESGHYYFDLFAALNYLQDFQTLFGNPDEAYDMALQRYYQHGAGNAWEGQFISRYASAHPLEDWAETWAHYLLITDAVETAVSEGFLAPVNGFHELLEAWMGFSVRLNQLDRTLGLGDSYPFVITPDVVEKLTFVDQAIGRCRRRT